MRLLRAGDLLGAATLLRRALSDNAAPPGEDERERYASGPECASTRVATETPPSPEAVTAALANGAARATQLPQEQRLAQFLSLSFQNAAGTRAYKLYIPSTYDGTACALIVMLHGCLQSSSDFAAGTRMNELAEQSNFVVAYPEQLASANSSRCWNWFNRGDQQRDRGEPSIIAGITREIMRAYAIDPSRVYAAGMSAGAAAAAVLGETYPDVYAAVGVHSGLMFGLADDVPSAFAAMRGINGAGGRRRPEPPAEQPIPTIVFHGDRDATVHPRNADRFAADVPARWTEETLAGQVAGGRAYTRTIYCDHDREPLLERWIVHGAHHAWAGGSAAGSYTDPAGPDASREMVRFFFAHSLRPRTQAAVP